MRGKIKKSVFVTTASVLVLALMLSGCIGNNKKETKEKDTAPPTVLITNPADGSTVNGTITIVVQANDNVGVSKVEIYIDNELKIEDKAAPYEYIWNTKTYPNGSRTIKAIAYDTSNNNNYHQITVNVRNEGGSEDGDEEPTYREETEQFTASIKATTGSCCTGNTHNWNVSSNARKVVAILNWSDKSWDLDIEIGVDGSADNGTVKASDSGGSEGNGEGSVALIYETVTNLEQGQWFAQITTKEKTITNGGTKTSWASCDYTIDIIIYYLDQTEREEKTDKK